MSCRALIILLAGFPIAAAALGQPLDGADRAVSGHEYRYAQAPDRDALENRINQLEKENAALKDELAARMPEERQAELERQVGRLQDENAALKNELAARNAELRAMEGEIAHWRQESAALKKELTSPAPPAPDKSEFANAGQPRTATGELDRRFGFIEKAWRRLIDVVGNLKRG